MQDILRSAEPMYLYRFKLKVAEFGVDTRSTAVPQAVCALWITANYSS